MVCLDRTRLPRHPLPTDAHPPYFFRGSKDLQKARGRCHLLAHGPSRSRCPAGRSFIVFAFQNKRMIFLFLPRNTRNLLIETRLPRHPLPKDTHPLQFHVALSGKQCISGESGITWHWPNAVTAISQSKLKPCFFPKT